MYVGSAALDIIARSIMMRTVLKKHMSVAIDISEELEFQGQGWCLAYVLTWTTSHKHLMDILKSLNWLQSLFMSTKTLFILHLIIFQVGLYLQACLFMNHLGDKADGIMTIFWRYGEVHNCCFPWSHYQISHLSLFQGTKC